MMFTVILTRRAQKEYDRLSKEMQPRVEKAIDNLRENPFCGKKLEGDHEGYWSMRVWPYRVIYTVDKKIITVTIVTIGDRKDVYRRFR